MSKKNKSIIITGAGTGIGRHCARKFLKAGYQVELIGRTESALIETAKNSENALVLTCDIQNQLEVRRSFQNALKKWGHLDLLFNNAGVVTPSARVDKISIDDWREVIDINLTGSFICAQEAFTIMKNQKPQGGRIINNGSISSHVPRPGSAPYTAAKHGVTGLTKSLSLDGRRFNIVCGQIDIGNALTEMTRTMQEGVMQANGTTAIEPTMTPEHVATTLIQMAEFPLDVNIQFVTIMASEMPYIGRG